MNVRPLKMAKQSSNIKKTILCNRYVEIVCEIIFNVANLG
jgi:hypothetical protein